MEPSPSVRADVVSGRPFAGEILAAKLSRDGFPDEALCYALDIGMVLSGNMHWDRCMARFLLVGETGAQSN